MTIKVTLAIIGGAHALFGSGRASSLAATDWHAVIRSATMRGCFSMALSLMLGQAGMTLERIETQAEVTLDKVGGGFEITSSHLNVVAKIPGADEAKFKEIANKAKPDCPVSKLFKAKITMDAMLEM